MIAAGVPLVRALEMCGKNPGLRGMRRAVAQISADLEAGHTFTDSMARCHGWLAPFDMALLSVGEASGRLDVSFQLLADYCAERAKILRDTISGLLSTVATVHVFLLIFPLGYLTGFVVGGLFGGQVRAALPFLTEKAAVFGGLYGVAGLLIYASQGRRGLRWRSLVENILRCVPILRSAVAFLVLSRLAAALEALTNAGVDVIKAWELAAAAAGSPRLIREIAGWGARMETGLTPADLVTQSGCFPELFVNLYHTGELSGKLDETLHRLRHYYQEEGFRALRCFTRVLNGVIYGLVVVVVAYSVISFWSHYYASALNGV